jgi:rhodanese-related sulfurtransferase
MRKALLMAMVLVACNRENPQDAASSVRSLSAAEFSEEIGNDAVLLDVRTPEEFSAGHIAGAVNLDFKANDFEDKLKSLDKSKDYMVYCAVGGRSGKAAVLMKDMGFSSITTLEGGLEAWAADGRPVEKEGED